MPYVDRMSCVLCNGHLRASIRLQWSRCSIWVARGWCHELFGVGLEKASERVFHRAPCQAISSFHSCLLRRIHAKFRVLGTGERQVCNLQVTKADGRDLRGKECFDVWDLDVRKLTYFVKTVSRSKKKRKKSSGATARSCCDNKAVFKQFSWIQMVQVWSQYGMMINPVGSPTLKAYEKPAGPAVWNCAVTIYRMIIIWEQFNCVFVVKVFWPLLWFECISSTHSGPRSLLWIESLVSTCLLFPGPLGCVGRQLLRRQVVFAASIGRRLNQSSLVPCPADSSVIGLLQLRMYLALQKAMCEGLLWVGSKKKNNFWGADVCIDKTCKKYCTNVCSTELFLRELPVVEGTAWCIGTSHFSRATLAVSVNAWKVYDGSSWWALWSPLAFEL